MNLNSVDVVTHSPIMQDDHRRTQHIARLRALVAGRQLAEAKRFSMELTQAYPQDVELWILRGGLHYQSGELDSVVACCERAIALDANNAGAHFSRGAALSGLGRMAEAEAAYREAIRISPGYGKAIAALAALLREQRRPAEARGVLEQAIANLPRDGFMHYNLGLVLRDLGEHEAARRAFETAVGLNGQIAEAHYGLGLLHYEADEYPAAVACLQRALGLNPSYPDALKTLAACHVGLSQTATAIDVYEHLLALVPDDVEAHISLAMQRLLLGDCKRGWPEYEWRLKHKDMKRPVTGKPLWDGSAPAGKTILLLGEQGLGDTLQFVRYAREVKARGATVILGCPPPLRRLLDGCDGVDRIVDYGDFAPQYDCESPLLSLPGLLGTTPDTIPAQVPYLHVPAGAGVAACAEIARHAGAFKIGLVWAGGSLHPNNRRRSCALEQFRPLLDVPGVRYFSLQKGEPVAELAALPRETVVDLAPLLEDFADTAAAIMQLDLVISVDTAVAHVAGALAKPVWLLLPFAPDWRWLLTREDTPWYPTMRLFRQSSPGDWRSVIARVVAELKFRPADK